MCRTHKADDRIPLYKRDMNKELPVNYAGGGHVSGFDVGMNLGGPGGLFARNISFANCNTGMELNGVRGAYFDQLYFKNVKNPVVSREGKRNTYRHVRAEK